MATLTTMQYLLDENVDLTYLDELARHEPYLVVRFVGQVGMPPKRTKDPDILIWCEEHDFVLVTNNRRTMQPHLAVHLAAGPHVPGIVMLNQALGIGGNLEGLRVIAGATRCDELRDQIMHVPT